MAIRLLNGKYNTQGKHLKYFNLILKIFLAGIVALMLFFANKKEKRSSEKEKAHIDNNLTETINIRLDGLENKNY
ncbi:MAG: hypothetical protein PHX78_00965 [bacterium]|nr:hypothetical protein [bacterium]